MEVRLEGLSRHYGPVVALDHLDLTLAPGELIALLGPSGCGKTTTLRLLAGLEDADSGRITVGGRDITHVSAAKRDMGMVFQAYSLFPHMTVRQNVAFGLRLRKIGSAQRDKRALEMLDLVGLSAQASRYPHQLSGGQQQRVALARALAIEPQVLLLDEPLSALDAKVRAQLRDEIRRIQLEVGSWARTVVPPRSTVTRLVAPRNVTAMTVPVSGPDSAVASDARLTASGRTSATTWPPGTSCSTSGSVMPRTSTSPPLTSPGSRLDRPTNSATNEVAGRE